MGTKQIAFVCTRRNFIIILYIFFYSYCAVSTWSLLDCTYRCCIYSLFNHEHIQNTWVCSFLFWGVMFEVNSCFRIFKSLFSTDLLWNVDWTVLLIIEVFSALNISPFFLRNSFLITDLFSTWVNFQDLLTIPLLKLLNLLHIFFLFFDRGFFKSWLISYRCYFFYALFLVTNWIGDWLKNIFPFL